ncbi:uncharacterized protein LOC144925782 isoform X1 [Branchiostoma floridae x Branchiostoma belcheri]
MTVRKKHGVEQLLTLLYTYQTLHNDLLQSESERAPPPHWVWPRLRCLWSPLPVCCHTVTHAKYSILGQGRGGQAKCLFWSLLSQTDKQTWTSPHQDSPGLWKSSISGSSVRTIVIPAWFSSTLKTFTLQMVHLRLPFFLGRCLEELYQDQIQMFVDAFKNPPQTREDGLYFEDRHYKCVRADKNAVYAKCGKRGLVIVRTGSLLIVGTYNDNMYPSVCVEAVEKLVDYFKEKGK